MEVSLADGEDLRTEISAKFTRDGLERELEAAGMALTAFYTDPGGLFGLALARAGYVRA
jgi:L-histidine Nalpha-methyltransferase